MKHESWVMLGLGAFFALTGVVYWLWSSEQGGSLMLVASGIMGFLPGSYYLWWSLRMRERPSDNPDASIVDGAGFVETFPGSSIWPFILGMGAFCIGLALSFGTWFAVPAIGLVIWALLGAVTESRRGEHSTASHDHH